MRPISGAAAFIHLFSSFSYLFVEKSRILVYLADAKIPCLVVLEQHDELVAQEEQHDNIDKSRYQSDKVVAGPQLCRGCSYLYCIDSN